MNTVLQKLGDLGVVPVVAIENSADSVPLGQALIAGGLPCAEITLRTPAALDAIGQLSAEFPEMLVGAGTVLNTEQAKDAIAAGAKFIVTPGFDAAVVDYCLAQNTPITPGVITPTEINLALNKGLSLVKFFPAEAAGGTAMLKAMSAPYQEVLFMPTGGIGTHNLSDYLQLGCVHACGGSWLVSRKLIANGDFAAITTLAAQAVEQVQAIRHKAW